MDDRIDINGYDMPQSAEPAVKVAPAIKEKREYTGFEAFFAALMILLGFLFVKLIMAGGLGIGATVFYLAFFISAAVFMKKSSERVRGGAWLEFALGVVASLEFTVFDNGFIHGLNLLFVSFLALRFCYTAANPDRAGGRFLRDSVKAALIMPFAGFSDCAPAVNSKISKKNAGKNIKYTIIGLLLALPVTFFAILLLSSADFEFSKMIDNIFNGFVFDAITLLFQILVGLPIAFMLFSVLYANVKRKSPALSNEYCDSLASGMRFVPGAVVYSFATPLCVVYLLFFISQARYFLSAFGGVLPDGFSYSEYARRGFFELCAVAVLNLIVIVLIRTFCAYSDGKRPAALRGYSIVISVFTIILIATAVSKMYLYTENYGLSLLRVYTTWFMLLLAAVFIIIAACEISPRLNFFKIFVPVFCVMFMALSWCGVDGRIAEYNIARYENGSLESVDVDMFYELSDSAVPYVAELILSEDDGVSISAAHYIESVLDREDEDLRSWNIARSLAHSAAQKYEPYLESVIF